MNSLGIDVGKKKCRAALKDERGDIIREFFFSNNNEGISIQSVSHYGKCTAVVESTDNMWIIIHDTLEENGIDIILANPYRTKIIAEAKIKYRRTYPDSIIDITPMLICNTLSQAGVFTICNTSAGFRSHI